jgi:TonB family protein
MIFQRILCALFVLSLFATPIGANARQSHAVPVPTAAACLHPNVDPGVIAVSEPPTPPSAIVYGVSGEVRVAVTLDAASHVTDVHVQESSSSVFDAAALESARKTTYQTQIVNCQPQAKSFILIVTFDRSKQAHPLYENPVTFLAGTWTCSTGSSVHSFTFTQTGTPDMATFDVVDNGRSVQTISQDQFGFWHVITPDGPTLTAFPWVDPVWKYLNGTSESDFERINDRTFIRTDFTLNEKGEKIPTSTTRCAKSASAR